MSRRLQYAALVHLFVAVFASQVAAQTTSESVFVFPPGPTSATPVEVHAALWCSPGPATVTVTGRVIAVHFAPPSAPCGTPPFLRTYIAPVPRLLEPGEYRVEVWNGSRDQVVATTSFVVRPVATPPHFELRPFTLPANDGSVLVRAMPTGESAICGRDCSAVSVLVGGMKATSVVSDGEGGLWFAAPRHAPGFAEVAITSSEGEWKNPIALYFADHFATPDLSVFERVLFPVFFQSRGVNGSAWVSEAMISNPNRWFVQTYNEIESYVCVTYPCGERIAPGEQRNTWGVDYPHGVALLVPRSEASALAFSLRVRDTSRAAEGFGTEVPVVRETEMKRGVVTLLNIPLDPRYRVKLRVYGMDPFPTNGSPVARVTLFPLHAGNRTERIVPLTRTCDPRRCASTPAYGEIDLPPGASHERINVYVRSEEATLVWAFATVTNSETQQVTIVTPDGSGGEPCHPCDVP